jgi:hypothetical protein
VTFRQKTRFFFHRKRRENTHLPSSLCAHTHTHTHAAHAQYNDGVSRATLSGPFLPVCRVRRRTRRDAIRDERRAEGGGRREREEKVTDTKL